jgi:hypothetical protein
MHQCKPHRTIAWSAREGGGKGVSTARLQKRKDATEKKKTDKTGKTENAEKPEKGARLVAISSTRSESPRGRVVVQCIGPRNANNQKKKKRTQRSRHVVHRSSWITTKITYSRFAFAVYGMLTIRHENSTEWSMYRVQQSSHGT